MMHYCKHQFSVDALHILTAWAAKAVSCILDYFDCMLTSKGASVETSQGVFSP